MTAKHKGLFILMVVVLLGVTGFYTWPGELRQPAQPVRQTARITLDTLQETVIATGVIRPVVGAEVNVGSRISGTVVNLPVEIGDRVRAGQLLAELDSTALLVAVDQMRADVALAMPRVALAESILSRRRNLAEDGLAAVEDVDTAVRDLAVAQAQLESSRARLRAAEINLSYTRITAPIDGVIAQVSTREGETVAADFSAPTFVTIVDLDRLEVLAYVDETDIGRVSVGQTVLFTVDTYPGIEFAAMVSAIQPKAELQDSVVNYVVRLQLEPVEAFVLRPEMTAHVRLVVAQRQQVVMAPRSAVVRRNGRQYVMREQAGDWLEQEITTGWRSADAIEILSGLKAGDIVQLNPIQEN